MLLSQVAAQHDRLASELLSILVSAGFLGSADAAGRFVATVSVSSAEEVAQRARLKETADELAHTTVPDLASNVKLIWVCMQALPQILTGACSKRDPCTQRLLQLVPLCCWAWSEVKLSFC